MKIISPYILGSGKASMALLEALRVVELNHPEWVFNAVQKISRDALFPDVSKDKFPLLIIANPHALHAKAILDAERAGFKLIICEKPSVTSLEQIHTLRKVQVPVAVCHVYRQMWGIQTLKEMIFNGEFGDIISIEGRYWQSSAAQKALSAELIPSWKNDILLSGPSDVVFDIGTHWTDAVLFLMDKKPKHISLWRSFANAEAPHRDTHVHLNMEFPNGARAMGSVSKTVHGSPNHFEINVIGTRKYGCWKFLEPDLLEISSGTTKSIMTRNRSDIGSGHWPHHGLGWIEGYVEIIQQALKNGVYPTLQENLDMMELLIKSMER